MKTEAAFLSAHNSGERDSKSAPPPSPPAKIHRVCISCNNMFEVPMDRIGEKHCPVCKG